MKSIMDSIKEEDRPLVAELTWKMAKSTEEYPRGVLLLSLQTLMLSALAEWQDVDSKVNEKLAKERAQIRFMELTGYMLEAITENKNEASLMLVGMLNALGCDIQIDRMDPEDDMENWGKPSFE